MSSSPPPPIYYKRIPEENRNVCFEKANYQSNLDGSPREIVISQIFETSVQKAIESAKVASSRLNLDIEKPFQMQFSVVGEKEESSCCHSEIVFVYQVKIFQGKEIKPYFISKQLTEVARTFFDSLNFTRFTVLTLFFHHVDPKLLNP